MFTWTMWTVNEYGYATGIYLFRYIQLYKTKNSKSEKYSVYLVHI